MTYHFLDHTADVKFVAEADTLENAFIESAKALQESICGKITILEQLTKDIQIEGTSLENLLYKFLEEFLVLLDSEDFLFSNIKNIQIDPKLFKLNATITGDKTENYKFTNDVKAVTYNEMSVEQNPEKNTWKIQVVLDV
jgi:SHS2 domain-containing protein